MIARRSQKIEHGAIVCDHDRRIAEACFHIIADDRRTFCDRLRSYGNQPLENVSEINVFEKQEVLAPARLREFICNLISAEKATFQREKCLAMV